jgi:DNA-binding MarR family transcriptional regulator
LKLGYLGLVPAQASFESIEVRAFVNFLRAHSAVTRQLDRELVTDHGLTINDYEVLLHLSRSPNRMMRRVDLAKRVVLTPSGITRLLHGLQLSGLVCKESCESDARVVYAKLTDKGAERLERASEMHLESIRELFFERFAPEELTVLAALLGRLHAHSGVDGDAVESG